MMISSPTNWSTCLVVACCFWSAVGNPRVATAQVDALPERNILVVITDDEGPTLGCYDDPAAKTPHVDQLAADGTRFTHAFATTASCSASRSVVLSGLHNHKNGQYGHQHHYHKFASYHNVVSLSLPRVLAGAGYRTARCGKFHVAPEEVYHFETTLPGADRNVVEMAENCRSFLEDRSDQRPFLLYFATNDPHRGNGNDRNSARNLQPNLFGNKPNRGSYLGVDEVFYATDEVPIPAFLSDTPETREELAQYYQSCARIDQGLGRLIEILQSSGLYDKTLVVFTSDHGMAFAGAKTTVYEPGLHVPLVVRNPYEPQRGVVSNARSEPRRPDADAGRICGRRWTKRRMGRATGSIPIATGGSAAPSQQRIAAVAISFAATRAKAGYTCSATPMQRIMRRFSRRTHFTRSPCTTQCESSAIGITN